LRESLTREGFLVVERRVEALRELDEALDQDACDLVVCEEAPGSFSAREALDRVRSVRPELPFIVVCDETREETAIELLRHGAQDCVPRGKRSRLLAAIEREMHVAAGRRARRRAELALRQSGRRFRQIVETAQEGIWILDLDGRTTYVNRQMASFTGIEPATAYGLRPNRLVHEESLATFMQRLQALDAPGASIGRFDCRMSRRDGSDFMASIALSSISDDHGAQAGFVAMVTDVTESRKLQEQLMISDRMASVGTLAAGVAHEINNPLAAILANLTLAVERLAPGEVRPPQATTPPAAWDSLHTELREALEAADRVKDIVRDLKVFSRSSETALEPVDVRPVVESSLRMAWNEIRHRAKVIRRLSPVPPVNASESRLSQVVLNLLINAAQAIPEGRADVNEIEVFAEQFDAGHVVVGVRDTGVGMSADLQRRLFTPFFTTKPIGVGTGLGLSICHRIISSFNGRIEVESAPGRGSTFRIVLPVNDQPRVAAPPPGPSPVASARGRVLVVDDEPLVARAVSRCLASDHEVVVSTSARESLGLLRGGQVFDVIICDLMMPDMSGMDFYREIEQLLPDLLPRLVYMTGGAFTPRARAFLEGITNPRIEKPFDRQTMRRVVADHLHKFTVPPDLGATP
jgi:PAS domain S-box-containing protein